jgi:hypothetical protein
MRRARSLARTALAAAAVALGAVACGDDGSGPGPQLTGRYALVSANDRVLPLGVDAGLSAVYELTASTLAFSGNRVIEEQRYQTRTFQGTITQTVIDTVSYSYTLRDDVLVFVRGAAQADTAERAGDLMAFEQTFYSSVGAPVRASATYTRIP